jgi:hypothetical protein
MPFPCHATTMPFWKRLLKATTQRGMGTTWERHGMCELASAVQRRHVGDLPAFGFFRVPRGVPRRLLPEVVVGLAVRIFPSTMRTFTKDTALSENGRGAAWHVWINAAWERHGKSELAFTQFCESALGSVTRVAILQLYQWLGLAPEMRLGFVCKRLFEDSLARWQRRYEALRRSRDTSLWLFSVLREAHSMS